MNAKTDDASCALHFLADYQIQVKINNSRLHVFFFLVVPLVFSPMYRRWTEVAQKRSLNILDESAQ